MAFPIAHAPHNGPVDTPGEGAYLYARSGVARSASTRSNFVAVQTAIDWIVRNESGAIISTTDISDVVLQNSLHVTQAINDEPDTCSFTLRPQAAPGLIPKAGDEIRITWAPGTPPLFYGFVVVTQADWLLMNQEPAWIAVQCQDPMWRFDARIVNHRFPAQSISDSIAYLIKWFCNNSDIYPHPLDFTTTYVTPGMPSIPAFDVVNQRPSTVMRTLTASVGGGFYIDGLNVHAWPESISEPLQTNPTTLTVGLKTLHTFRRSEDATQVRRRVLVEGRRTSTLVPLPAGPQKDFASLGAPLQDATIFPTFNGEDIIYLARFGTQWMMVRRPMSVTANGANSPQTKVAYDFLPIHQDITLEPIAVVPPSVGWVRVGNQYTRYTSINGNPTTGNWALNLPVAEGRPYAYGVFTAPINAGDTVEWVDGCLGIYPHGVAWYGQGQSYGADPPRAHPTNTPVVTLAYQQIHLPTDPDRWPQLEGFVQDGRYSYVGAQARADSDLDTFKDPLVSVEWETDDLNAIPGRSQVIDLSSPAVTPPIQRTVTILATDISFPLRTLPPRRRCTGGVVKPSTFLDLVVTTQN